MTTRAADDFDAIRKRIEDLKREEAGYAFSIHDIERSITDEAKPLFEEQPVYIDYCG